MEHESSLPPLESSMSPFIINQHLPSLNAFGVITAVTIERIVHSMSVPIVVNLLQDTPLPLALLPNATFVVDGDIPLISAQSKCVQFVINVDMWQTTVLLRRFLLNRWRTFTQVPLSLSPVPSRGVLIEPGAQWYKGGNVTIFLLFHSLLLLVFSRRIHVLFGMCRYNYVSLLLVVHPFHSRVFILWLPHAVLPYYRKGIFLAFILLSPWTFSPPLGSLVPSM